jgi:hypothetical protein
MAKFGIVLSQTPIQVNLRRLLRIICGRKPAFLHRLPKMSEEIPPQSSPTANLRMRLPLKVGSNGGWETTRGQKKKRHQNRIHPSLRLSRSKSIFIFLGPAKDSLWVPERKKLPGAPVRARREMALEMFASRARTSIGAFSIFQHTIVLCIFPPLHEHRY